VLAALLMACTSLLSGCSLLVTTEHGAPYTPDDVIGMLEETFADYGPHIVLQSSETEKPAPMQRNTYVLHDEANDFTFSCTAYVRHCTLPVPQPFAQRAADADHAYAERSLNLTEQWLGRCIKRFKETEPRYGYHQSLFPIVQGCVYPDLRTRAAERVAEVGAEGNAIGGLSVGEPTEVMYEMIELVNAILPADKPRYLMGVGTPANLLEAIERGVDMFDCIMPTRNGRNGQLFTARGTMNMRNRKWADDFSPIDPDGHCAVDLLHSRAYLHHLFRAEELLALQIASIHNLAFYLWLVGEARRHILAGNFTTWKAGMVKQLSERI